MFDKFSLKHWIIIFAVLGLLVVIYEIYPSQKGKSSFKTDIIQIDTAQISSISYYKNADKQNEVSFIKNNGHWDLKQGDLSTSADDNAIKNIVNQLLKIKPLRLAAKSESQWNKYDVSDSTGTRVIVKEGDKTTLDIMIGRFSAEQSNNPYSRQPDIYTYIRLSDETEVYMVEGFLSMAFSEDVSMFRNKTITKLNASDITSIELTSGNSSYKAVKKQDKWEIDNQIADSTKMANYIREIANLRNSNFAKNKNSTNKKSVWNLKIEGNNFGAVNIEAFPADSSDNFIIHSSLNQDNSFVDKDLNLTNTLVMPKDSLL